MPSRKAIGLLIGIVAAWVLAMPGSAQEPPSDLDGFRADLLTFAAELEAVPGLAADKAAGLSQAISALGPEQIARLAERAPRDADWRALPGVLSRLDEVRARRQERLAAKVAAMKTASLPGDELEEFRTDFLLFVQNLRVLAPLAPDGRLGDQLASIEQQIAETPVEHLGQLRRMYYRNAPRWLYVLRNAAAGGDKDFDLIPTIPNLDCDIGCPCDLGCDLDCSCTEVCAFGSCTEVCDPFCLAAEELCEATEALCDLGCDAIEALCEGLDEAISGLNSVIDEINGFLNDVVSFFEDVVDEILALPTTLGNFFTELGTDLIDLLEELFDLLLEVVSDELSASNLLSLMGLDVSTTTAAASVLIDVAEAAPVISIPCPDIGVDIPGFGTVGTPRAEYVCKRGLDWIAEKLFDLVPSDSPSVALKIFAALGYFPIKYYCMCLEAQSALCFADGQATHRELVASLLDVELSTRADQTSVDALQSDASALDASVAGVQSDTGDVETDVAGVSSDLKILASSLESYSGAQTQQAELVAAFEELVRRIRIEENLLQQSSEDVVALFQSPEDFAGFLEVVREIVVDTITANLDVGQLVFDAAKYLDRADARFSEGAFEKAYDDYRRAYREAVRE